jgi:hypothetical protein
MSWYLTFSIGFPPLGRAAPIFSIVNRGVNWASSLGRDVWDSSGPPGFGVL